MLIAIYSPLYLIYGVIPCRALIEHLTPSPLSLIFKIKGGFLVSDAYYMLGEVRFTLQSYEKY